MPDMGSAKGSFAARRRGQDEYTRMKVDRTRNWIELLGPVFEEDGDEAAAVDADIDGDHLDPSAQREVLAMALGTQQHHDQMSGHLDGSGDIGPHPRDPLEHSSDDNIFDTSNERQSSAGPGPQAARPSAGRVTFDASDVPRTVPDGGAEMQPIAELSTDEFSTLRTPSSWYTGHPPSLNSGVSTLIIWQDDMHAALQIQDSHLPGDTAGPADE
ncbi:hypothetical protein CERZMDRAFT_101796 [Cercospora zeae-maydis SCOH1-5]|uniref:Uncharacterized protein n=1 Tax=Cercospora zeae-maydis SCOH1-5 TaxID=717836 RepID=A0A6A6F3U9_9PEZI|nr:hypothetical protein CERZMDRAFT_101796 [Cercospora zeae-maydis SCOH1-5]